MVIPESLGLSLYFQLKLLTKLGSVSLSSLIGQQMFQKYPLDICHIIIYKLISTSSGCCLNTYKYNFLNLINYLKNSTLGMFLKFILHCAISAVALTICSGLSLVHSCPGCFHITCCLCLQTDSSIRILSKCCWQNDCTVTELLLTKFKYKNAVMFVFLSCYLGGGGKDTVLYNRLALKLPVQARVTLLILLLHLLSAGLRDVYYSA